MSNEEFVKDSQEKARKQCVALVNAPPPPLDDLPIAVGLCVSIGLAQFLTEVEMTEHAQFNQDDPDHIDLLKEFTDLKNIMREEITPVLEAGALMDALRQMFGGEVLGEVLDDIVKEMGDGKQEGGEPGSKTAA